ncbi:hypothetical protein ILYODFUR_024333 [Ilyodon furcidens]|uniref:Uncharacterized protein n=1 Tax=Ilyodon furcidens TaxID=33524 RepID=A0ABV0TQ17_9TELE
MRSFIARGSLLEDVAARCRLYTFENSSSGRWRLQMRYCFPHQLRITSANSSITDLSSTMLLNLTMEAMILAQSIIHLL